MANYDIAEHWEDLSPDKKARVITLASDEQLEKWASDPECNQMLLCGVDKRARAMAKEHIAQHRTEVSAGMNLKHELKSLSVRDLVFFLWKFWWAAFLAGLIPAIVIFVVALIVKRIE
jgi:hypothetical protein